MELTEIVYALLKEKKLTKGWLASKVQMKPDGFRLALVKHSIKFDEIYRMAEALQVSPSLFFSASQSGYAENTESNYVSEPDKREEYHVNAYKNEINTLKSQNKNLRDEINGLKQQLADKTKIIKLLEEKRKQH